MAYERDERGGNGRRDYGGYDREQRGDPRDRGFFERAGDEVRSWFGDDEAERRRRYDEREDERSDRERYASSQQGGYRSPTSDPGWYRSNQDEFRRGSYSAARGYVGGTDQGGRGYGGDDDYRSREQAYRSGQGGRPTAGRDRADTYGGEWTRGYNRDEGRSSEQRHVGHDEHGHANWRDRQLSAFDRDYDEYRRENQSRFETEFATWRQNRQTQRDSLTQVKEHQEVIGSDGAHVGTVDHVRSDHILLTKTDKDAGGHHHSIPSSWIASVGEKVQLSKTGDDAKRAWRDTEERGGPSGGDRDRGRGEQGGRGLLDRSFSGTY
ncbi:DUF2171 domain-containing protein [Sphingomonas sp.]|uniref:DUF2171 domain-containing protein n=1 Tax=Sphingomonas sp. TaxID=28214 RepID=UPI003B005351